MQRDRIQGGGICSSRESSYPTNAARAQVSHSNVSGQPTRAHRRRLPTGPTRPTGASRPSQLVANGQGSTEDSASRSEASASPLRLTGRTGSPRVRPSTSRRPPRADAASASSLLGEPRPYPRRARMWVILTGLDSRRGHGSASQDIADRRTSSRDRYGKIGSTQIAPEAFGKIW
jgi:hypothetical protein